MYIQCILLLEIYVGNLYFAQDRDRQGQMLQHISKNDLKGKINDNDKRDGDSRPAEIKFLEYVHSTLQ